MEKRFEFKEVEHPLDLYDTEIAIVDNETDNIISYDNACIVLNEQDKKIKELEEQLRLSKMSENFEQEKKNNALRFQNSKAIEVLERAKIEFETYYADNIWNYPKWLDDKITELRGEK